ncbi:hypothetical protein B0O99DRAFT_645425 [Bisporella sp. PMI_857]|nr:hypothetical protein B0O99DRAFT_645425 [Bisporella sp. PMI_857]
MRQGKAKVGSLLLIIVMNQTTTCYFSRSFFRLSYRSQVKAREPNPLFSIWNNQHSTGLKCKATEQNQGWVSARVIDQVGCLSC